MLIQNITLYCNRNPTSYINLYVNITYPSHYILFTDGCHSDFKYLQPQYKHLIIRIKGMNSKQIALQTFIQQKVRTEVKLYECINGSKYTFSHYRLENGSLQFFTYGCQEECLLVIKQAYSSLYELERVFVGDVLDTEHRYLAYKSYRKLLISMCPVTDSSKIYNISILHSPATNRYI